MTVDTLPVSRPSGADLNRRMLTNTSLDLRQILGTILCDYLVKSTDCAALLWLWDEEWKMLVLNRHGSPGETSSAPPELCRRFAAPRAEQQLCGVDAAAWKIGFDDQPEVRRWAERVIGPALHEQFFSVAHDDGDTCTPLAFVQVITTAPLAPEVEKQLTDFMPHVAATIMRSRQEREFKALRRVLLELDELSAADAGGHSATAMQERWIAAAAATLGAVSRAKACILFRRGADGRFESTSTMPELKPGSAPLIASEEGVIGKVVKSCAALRLYDLRRRQPEDGELFDAIRERLLPEEPFSALIVPIVFQKEAIATLMLINKKAEFHLAEVFSGTDEQVGLLVARFVGGLIPTFRLYETIERMSYLTVPGALNEEESRGELFRLLRDELRKVEAAALLIRQRSHEDIAVRMMGGERWFETAEEVLPPQDTPQPAPGKPGRFCFTQRIPHMVPEDCYLTVLTRSASIGTHEKQTIAAFCNELSHALRAEADIRQALDNMQQTRHAFRARVNLVGGELYNAVQRLEICRNERRMPTDDPIFTYAMENARAEVRNMRISLDASTVLLSEVRPETLRLESASLLKIVSDVEAAVGPVARRRNIAVEMKKELQPVTAMLDRELMFHAVFNVADNAAKYTPDGGRMSVHTRMEGGAWIVEVRNEGSYIPPEDRERIFLPFTRRPGFDAAVQGHGIGLALTKKVVEAHGGTIAIESSAEGKKETRFTIAVPLAAVTAETSYAAGARTIHHLEDEPTSMAWIPRILRDHLYLDHRDWMVGDLEQDGPVQRFTITRGGRSETIVYRVYATLEEFDRVFQGREYRGDVVLLDALRNTESGQLAPHGLLAYRRATEVVGRQSTFFLTAFPQELLNAQYRDIPPENILSKPIDGEELVDALATALGLRA